VERALGGQRLAPIATAWPRLAGGVELAEAGGQPGVAAAVVVVVEVLGAPGQGRDPRGDQLLDGGFEEIGIARVGEAGGELSEEAGEWLGRAEPPGLALGGEVAPVEVGEDPAGAEQGKVEVGGVPLCSPRAASGRCPRGW
jgi:hypothetical protein